jgi:hypothetical protein
MKGLPFLTMIADGGRRRPIRLPTGFCSIQPGVRNSLQSLGPLTEHLLSSRSVAHSRGAGNQAPREIALEYSI